MAIALTRDVSPEIVDCELTFLERSRIDPVKARLQHTAYRNALSELGLTNVNLPSSAGQPDAVFVEDPAVVLDEVAVVARLGARSRQAEAEEFSSVIGSYRPLRRIQAPGTLEGGDVLRIGKTLYVGLSSWTSRSG
ncbi:MAG: dimethylargininase, partial [Deltaproteobacteria bacterium]|nr:dimethylargininase [Deltaproteobacteria bacterium]